MSNFLIALIVLFIIVGGIPFFLQLYSTQVFTAFYRCKEKYLYNKSLSAIDKLVTKIKNEKGEK